MHSQCENCGVDFKYTPSQSRGRFCSNTCQGEHKYRTQSIPKILEGKSTNVNSIKRYLSETVGHKCVWCGNEGKHNGKDLVLQLDHIDGNSDNNNLENLRLLCPNCHSQTGTFGSRQKKDTKRNRYLRHYKNGRVA